MEVHHLNPGVLLHHAMSSSGEFAANLLEAQRVSATNVLRICVYMDKSRPGNELRPDEARNMQCIYFNFIDLPAWFRSRGCGLCPFLYVLQKRQDKIDNLALDTLFKMEVLMGKINIIKRYPEMSVETSNHLPCYKMMQLKRPNQIKKLQKS